MKYVILILPFLAASALAQQEDVYKTLGLEDRVQVTFRSGGTITGKLKAVSADPKRKPASVDYTKEKAITVDLSLEYPGLNGTMTIFKDQIKEIRKIQNLTKEESDRLKKIKEEVRKQIEEDEAKRRKAEADRDERARKEAEEFAKRAKRLEADVEGDVVKKLERLKKALEVYNRFPSPPWGPEKLGEIARKSQGRLPITPEERDFQANYDLWREGRDASEKKAPEKKEEKPPEEKKP